MALFAVALDTLLRASDLLALRVADVLEAGGGVRASLAIQQKKTNQVLPVEISETTRSTVARWITEARKRPEDYLFTGERV
ncbi:tyrosine-type recombinase/integrase, partial [Escherichia coli]